MCGNKASLWALAKYQAFLPGAVSKSGVPCMVIRLHLADYQAFSTRRETAGSGAVPCMVIRLASTVLRLPGALVLYPERHWCSTWRETVGSGAVPSMVIRLASTVPRLPGALVQYQERHWCCTRRETVGRDPHGERELPAQLPAMQSTNLLLSNIFKNI